MWSQLYDAQPDASTANYNMEAMRTFRGQRFAESIAKNPNFAFFPLSVSRVQGICLRPKCRVQTADAMVTGSRRMQRCIRVCLPVHG